ncbi:MAG: 2-oxoacid:acceptor oxidoreductase family protein [bacterium]|nr:2-oxoacid:acceptor oxidoreductase family protein [bacterium]MDT8395936.1 2-oxoacid:acceptor oxidoreductase family protein [bacterium]
MRPPKLPMTNELGYYEIRMESIGGMGANLAGQILAEACILEMGYNGVNFASYGSEKKGTPVKSFIRLGPGDKEIADNAPVESPHMLVVFAEGLLGTVPLTQGFKKGGVVVVNTTRTPDEIMDLMELPGCLVVCVDAMKIAMEEKIPLNTALLGAVSKASGFIDPESIKNVIKAKIGKRYPHLVEGNMNAFDRGFNEIREKDFTSSGKYPEVEFHRAQPGLGYDNEPFGGIITNPGNSLLKNHAASRTGYIPLWHSDKCTHCGDCDLTCPDHCMVFEMKKDDKGKDNGYMLGVDYNYCKGCLRCVAICPSEALTTEVETEHDVNELRADLRRVL